MLREENERLKARIEELERLLASYENAHTPPSLRKKSNKKPKSSYRKPGRPPGHKGSTRPQPKPDKVVNVTEEKCPNCNSPLGEPIGVESRIIEDIPEPQPVTVTEFRIAHYNCPSCGNHVIATHPDCPSEGNFGKRALAHITLLKYSERLPHRKVCETLEREFGLRITPATVLDLTRRVSDALRAKYDAIKKRIRSADVVYVDETGIRVNGAKYWIWVFVTDTDTLVVIRHSRGKNVLKEVLGKHFNGTIVCDGWKSYPSFSKQLQRCWAHLLREARFVAKKFAEAVPLCESLHDFYNGLTRAIKEKPPPDERKKLWESAYQKLSDLTKQGYVEEKVRDPEERERNKNTRNDHQLLSYLETAKFKPLPTNYYSGELNTYQTYKRLLGEKLCKCISFSR
ncbi:MAG: IS66 family transposase [Candidatus Methanospirareceae archaeon]